MRPRKTLSFPVMRFLRCLSWVPVMSLILRIIMNLEIIIAIKLMMITAILMNDNNVSLIAVVV